MSADEDRIAEVRPLWLSLWSRYGSVFLVAAVSLLFQLLFFDRWFSAMDEGHMLQFADMVAKGGELYRDATLYPLPGAFYLLALIFHIFDPSILVSRWVVVLEFSLFVVLVFLFLRRLVPGWYAALAVLLMLLYRVWVFPHWHIYSYSTTALLILFGSLLMLLRFFETGNRRVLALAGLLLGLGTLCKQDYGAAGLLAMSVPLVVHARSSPVETRERLSVLFGWFVAPAALVGAATALHFLRQGLLGDLIQFTVLNAFVSLATLDWGSFPSLLPLFVQDPQLRSDLGIVTFAPGIIFTVDARGFRESFLYIHTALYDTVLKAFFYGPYILLSGGVIRLWWRRKALERPRKRQAFLRELTLFSFAAALIALVSFNRPQDYLHLAVLYWPLICLGVVYTHAILGGRRRIAWILAVLLLLPAGGVLAYTGRLAWRLRTVHSERVPGERAGISVKPSEAQLLREVVDYVRSNSIPGETVAVMPYFPIVNFLSDRRGPHRSSYIVWPIPELPERDRRIIDAMEAIGTRLVIYDFGGFPSFPPFEEYAPELFSYLVEHFEIDRVFSYDAWGYVLGGLRRRVEPLEGRPLLGAGGMSADLSVEMNGVPPRVLPPDKRAEYLAMDLWPVRPVLTLRPTAGGGRSVLSVPLDVPVGARLRTAVGVNPRLWFDEPKSWVRFVLEVESDGEHELLFSRTLDPTVVIADRGWFEIDASLEAYAGRSVLLQFSTGCEGPSGETFLMGGWAEPRIVSSALSSKE